MICTFKVSLRPKPDPGGTTHIRLTSLPSGLGRKKKKKNLGTRAAGLIRTWQTARTLQDLIGSTSAQPSGSAHLPRWSCGLVSGPPVCWASVSCSSSPLLVDLMGLERVRLHSFLNLYLSRALAQYNPLLVLIRFLSRSVSLATLDFFISSPTAPGVWSKE